MADTDPLQIAKRLTAGIVAGDVEAVGALYHDDLVGWRNVDGRELDRRQMLKIVGFLARDVSDLRYEQIQVHPTPRGYVQQHVLRATAPDGTAVEVPACLVVSIEGDRIVRLDEYMDGAALAPLMG